MALAARIRPNHPSLSVCTKYSSGRGNGETGGRSPKQCRGIHPARFSEDHPALRTSSVCDLLPSGLYRRPRSFTGSWGFNALVIYHERRGLPSRALPPIGNWEVKQIFPHPAPKVFKLTSISVASLEQSSQGRRRQEIVKSVQCYVWDKLADGLPRNHFFGRYPRCSDSQAQTRPHGVHLLFRFFIHLDFVRPGASEAFGRPFARGVHAHFGTKVRQP
jgi:hypothetical protein